MEEKGSNEEPMEIGTGVGLNVTESDPAAVGYLTLTNPFPIQSQRWIDTNTITNSMSMRQMRYHPYVIPDINYATDFTAAGSSSASEYLQASLPIKRVELKKIDTSSWFVTPPEVANLVTYGNNVWYGMPQLEGEMQQKIGSESSQSLIQDGISTTDGSGSKNAVVKDSASTKRNKGKKPGGNYANDCRRRRIIRERLKALEELVPQTVQGYPCDVLEDTIDYVRYLQQQLKDLSRSRLRGEPVLDPLHFIEGYGHYLGHEPNTSEPLEEMLGRMLEMNPQDAAAVLESKGLYIREMSLATELAENL